MNKRIKLLALIMSLVMVLGVMAALPITINASVASFDIRYAYEFVQANDTDGKYADILDSYKTVGRVPYVTTAPALDGAIDEANYTVKNSVTTHSHASVGTVNGPATGAETTAVTLNEYFAQDADYIYIAFEMPDFDASLTPHLFIRSSTAYGSVTTNHNIYGMWNTPALSLVTDPSTGDTTIAMNNGKDHTGSHPVNFAAWTATGAETTKFAAPAEGSTTAYVEYKIPKAQFMSTMGLSALEGFSYVFAYTSTDGSAVKTNYVSNYLLNGSAANKAAYGSNQQNKHLFRYVKLADFRYDVPAATTTITEASVGTAPVVDGTIDTANYTTANEVASGVTEYTAIDDNYLYLAIKLPASITGASYIRFWTGNNADHNSSNYCAYQVQFAANSTAVNYAGQRLVSADQMKVADCGALYWSKDYVNAAISEDGTQFEFKFSLQRMYDASNNASTTTQMYCPYDSLLDVNNFRYTFTYNIGGEKTVNYTPTGTDASLYGASARARNINFDLRELFEPITDARTDYFQFGYGAVVDGFKTPALDGVISADEYTVIKADGAGSKDCNIGYARTQAFAHDLQNIYLSFITTHNKGYFRLQASADSSIDSTYYNNIQLQYKTDGTVIVNGGRNTEYGARPVGGVVLKIVDSAYKANADGTYTYEIAINKGSIMASYGLSGFDNIRIAQCINEQWWVGSDLDKSAVALALTKESAFAHQINRGIGSNQIGQSIMFTGDEPAINDIRTDLEVYGYANHKVNEMSSAVVDGKIDANDNYATTVDGVRNNLGSNVKASYAYDADYVYQAMVLPNSVTSFYYYLWDMDSGVALANNKNRNQIQFVNDGTHSVHGRRDNDDSLTRMAYSLTNADIQFAIQDNGDGTSTWEIAFKRQALKLDSKTSSTVFNFRYALNCNNKFVANITDAYLNSCIKATQSNWNNGTYLPIVVDLCDSTVTDARDLETWGYDSADVQYNANVNIDVTDAKFDAADYSVSRAVNPGLRNDLVKTGHTVTEYFAHDDDWVYVAFTATNANPDMPIEYYLWLVDSPAAKDSDIYNRFLFNFDLAEGTVSFEGIRAVSGEGKYKPTGAFGSTDYAGSIAYDEATKVLTGELKFSKAAMLVSGHYENVAQLEDFATAVHYWANGTNSGDGMWSLILKSDNTKLFNEVLPTLGEMRNGENWLARGTKLHYDNLADIVTDEKASARIDTVETTGIRFRTTLSKLYLEEIKALADEGTEITVGTLIAPEDYLGTEFDKLDMDLVKIGENCLNVVAAIDQPYAQTTTTLTFTGAIVNIKVANVERDFAAVGYVSYVKDGQTVYVYSDVMGVRNIREIAKAALEANEYKNNTQKTILETLAGVQA